MFSEYKPDALNKLCSKFNCPGCYCDKTRPFPCETEEFQIELKRLEDIHKSEIPNLLKDMDFNIKYY